MSLPASSSADLAQGRLLALVAPVFWSLTGVTVRYMESATEWQINFYRSGALAVFVFVVLAFRYRSGVWRAIRVTGITGVLGGAFVGLAMVCSIVALKHTTVANAVLFMATGPVVAAILARIWLGEQVTSRTWLAIALAALGVAIMMSGSLASGSLFGDSIAFFGVLLFGVYAVMLRARPGVDMTPAVLYAGVFSSAAGALGSLLTGVGLVASKTDTLLSVSLGVVQLGFGSVLFAAAARTVPATELTLFALGEPLLAPVWTWIGVGEVPVPSTMVGGAVLILALGVQATGGARDG